VFIVAITVITVNITPSTYSLSTNAYIQNNTQQIKYIHSIGTGSYINYNGNTANKIYPLESF